MTSISAIASSSSQPFESVWISPQEQLRQLAKPIKDEIARESILSSAIGDIAESNIAQIVAEYAMPALWYRVLVDLKALPDQLPRLSPHIHQILGSACPLFSDRKRSYRIEETHVLYLDPFRTINELEKVVRIYGQNHRQSRDFLQLQFPNDEALRAHAAVQSNPEWILIPKWDLKGGRSRTYDEHAKMVEKLNQESSVQYKIPSLKNLVAACFLHYVAMKKKLFHENNLNQRTSLICMRAQETIGKHHLCVGSTSSGLHIRSGDLGHQTALVPTISLKELF